MQSCNFDLYLQCQKKQNDMKTKEQKKKDLVEEICLMTKAIRMTEELKNTNAIGTEKYEEDIIAWAKRIKVLTDKLNDINDK